MSNRDAIDKPVFDGDWFRDKITGKGETFSSLARHLEIDKSAVSRMFKGERKMKVEEVNGIASFLGVPVKEVLRHAGASIDLDGRPTRILLAATIGPKGQVERLSDPKPLPQSVIDRAQAAITMHGNGKIVAAQIRALDGPLALLDDAVVLFKHTDTVEPASIGTLSICRSYAGDQILAKIERARKTGEARVISADGKIREFDLHTATPVLAIIP